MCFKNDAFPSEMFAPSDRSKRDVGSLLSTP